MENFTATILNTISSVINSKYNPKNVVDIVRYLKIHKH
jgi:hypothetical protein